MHILTEIQKQNSGLLPEDSRGGRGHSLPHLSPSQPMFLPPNIFDVVLSLMCRPRGTKIPKYLPRE